MGLPYSLLWSPWLIFKTRWFFWVSNSFCRGKGKGKGKKQVLSTEESSVEEIVTSSRKWLRWLETGFAAHVHGVWWNTGTRWCQRSCQTVRSGQWYWPINFLHTKIANLRSWRENATALQFHLKTQGKRKRSCAQLCSTHEHCCLSAG